MARTLKDCTSGLSGRYFWHGPNEINLQPSLPFSGAVGRCVIRNPDSAREMHFWTVSAGDLTDIWKGEKADNKLSPGKSRVYEASGFPDKLNIWGPTWKDQAGGTEGSTYIPGITESETLFAGAWDENKWILIAVIVIIMLIILVGLYVTAAKATRGG
jgi:hypothetical protein